MLVVEVVIKNTLRYPYPARSLTPVPTQTPITKFNKNPSATNTNPKSLVTSVLDAKVITYLVVKSAWNVAS